MHRAKGDRLVSARVLPVCDNDIFLTFSYCFCFWCGTVVVIGKYFGIGKTVSLYETRHVISNNVAFCQCRLRGACAASVKLRNSKCCMFSCLTVIEYSSG